MATGKMDGFRITQTTSHTAGSRRRKQGWTQDADVLSYPGTTILGHTGSTVSPVVTFTPNWKKIFTGESITMTCDVGSTGAEDLTYYWYKDYWVYTGKIYTITSANTWDSGNYRCLAGSERSSTARLDVVADPVILRVPLDVHEGDDLTLRCHHRSGYKEIYTVFYKDDSAFSSRRYTFVLPVGIVNMRDTGRYKCTKEITLHTDVTSTDEAFISIQQLFGIPEIKVALYPVVEGDEMTLTCDTSLSPLRPRTQLKFAFHKDGRNVQGFTSYNQYGFQSAEVKDSGKYSCEVTTATYSVRKRSQEKLVEINELFINSRIRAMGYPAVEGDHMVLTCNTSLSPLRQRTELQFAFYRDGRNVKEFSSSDQYEVQFAQLENSGNYSCDVKASNVKVRKSSHFIHIMIKELFFTPVLNVSAINVLEGDAMNLTCNTSLSPLRQRTELQFAFYRDGRNVQDFSLSDQYGVQSAQLEDSGNYSCKVRSALTSNITKKSKDAFVQIRGKF
ncbi:Fc receptor-like protein 3 [Aquarana catesbeiana]|uniref:Fc receptor-like protein 3 n=1 Tax=Aquarana catesbeiana TaxID=8400 RepID=UPI003CC9B9D5